MSAMLYREPNQVKWVGIRPGHNGTQVIASSAANNSTVILYTVTAGKVFYLSYANLVMYARNFSLTVALSVRNAADVLQYSIATMASGDLGHLSLPVILNPPLEIPAGWDVVVSSNDALCNAYAFIHGWEE